jgi:hypothetical protein
LSDHARRLARAEQYLACDRSAPLSLRGELQLICIRGGIPTASGGPEATIGGNVLVPDPGEDLDEFKARVATEARLLRAKFAVISGLPPRLMVVDDAR